MYDLLGFNTTLNLKSYHGGHDTHVFPELSLTITYRCKIKYWANIPHKYDHNEIIQEYAQQHVKPVIL